jgi:hypothetical protein
MNDRFSVNEETEPVTTIVLSFITILIIYATNEQPSLSLACCTFIYQLPPPSRLHYYMGMTRTLGRLHDEEEGKECDVILYDHHHLSRSE